MPDFKANESAYRNGVATENGILIRKASWKCTAKPIVEAAQIFKKGNKNAEGETVELSSPPSARTST